MSSAVRGVSRLAAGRWTPFLSPAWGDEERAVVSAYLRGQVPAGRQRLQRVVPGGGALTTTGSGRAAIRAVLLAARFPVGSEVVLPSFSCTGLVEPVLEAGLSPVLVDVDDSLNIDGASVREAVGPRTVALLVPHLAGVWAAARDDLADLARDRGLLFIEDAAQAAGLRGPADRPAGLAADVGIFSTGVGKPLFGPGGGFAVVRDQGLAERLADLELPDEPDEVVRQRVRAFWGTYGGPAGRRGRHEVGGVLRSRVAPSRATSRRPLPLVSISDVEAEIAALRWSDLERQQQARAGHARRWRDLLDHTGMDDLRTAPFALNSFSKFWIDCGARGPEFAARMRSSLWRSGVETESLYRPLHLREDFRGCRRTALPRTEALAPVVFSLPVRADLDDVDWQRITSAVRALAG